MANRSCYKNGSTEVFLKNILFTVILVGLSSWGGVAVAQNAPLKMTLFAMVDGELRVIFSEPMYAFKDVAGEWNKDRTRQHHVYESENTLRVAQTAHHGYFDLIVQAKKKGWRKVFQWDPRVRRYVAIEIKRSP